MKNGRYFNFRDICNRNLWDTGYFVKKLQGYRILRPPPPPNGAHHSSEIRTLHAMFEAVAELQRPLVVLVSHSFLSGHFCVLSD